jgi:hypothetical protein
MHELAILRSDTPDVHVKWDPMNAAEVAEARAIFDRAMTGTGSLAFDVKTGDESEVIKHFDPEAQHIVVSSPLVGG